MSQKTYKRMRVNASEKTHAVQGMPIHESSEPTPTPEHPLKAMASRLGNRRFRQTIARTPLPGAGSMPSAFIPPILMPPPPGILSGTNPKRKKLLSQPFYADTYDFTTSWGAASKFDVVYHPTADWSPAPDTGPVHGTTHITLKVFLNFIPFDLTTAKKQDPKYKKYKPSEEDKKDFEWPKGETEKFRKAFEAKASSGWTEKHKLTCNELFMDDITSDVKVRVVTVDDEKLSHHKFDVMWLPKGAPELRSNSSFLDSRDNEGEEATHGIALDAFGTVEPFGYNDDRMTTPLKAQADELLDEIDSVRKEKEADPTFKKPKMTATVAGYASSQGNASYNQKLSERRAKSVKSYMTGKAELAASDIMDLGIGEEGTGTQGRYRRVVVRAYDDNNSIPVKSTHIVSAHEVGHVFGMDDEYVDTDVKRTYGEKPEHHDEVGDELGDEAADATVVGAHEESIMASGDKVLPAHYTYFIKALESVTGVQWTIK